MSILIVRGPEATRPLLRGPSPLPGQVLRELVTRAGQAGRVIALRSCSGRQELFDTLRTCRHGPIEMALVAPGACSRDRPLRALLEGLECAFIEVHEDRPGHLEPCLPPLRRPPLAVVQGYAAQSYVMALAIALEELGCSECGNDFHVGT